MNKIIRIVLFICIVILVIISIAAHFDFIPGNLGIAIKGNFGLLAGLSSIIGLLAFAVPVKIRSTDFENEELEKLKSLFETTEELKKIENNKNKTKQELVELAQKKKVMELSIKRAGLVLFYQEQFKKSIAEITEKLESDTDLKNSINNARDSMKRLEKMNEEIETDENVILIKDIIKFNGMAAEQKTTYDNPIDIVFNTMIDSITKIIRL